jgi:sugar transferase (PEP-CTERM/EpsH1 system associated)
MNRDAMTTAPKTILVLCHRIPYPADKGDKIRNFHLIKALSKKARVVLGCFIDEPFDQGYASQLSTLADVAFCRPMFIATRVLNATVALLRGTSITESFYNDAQMRRFAAEHSVTADAIFVASAAMARYIPTEYRHKAVLDFVDFDSEKWLHYANQTANPLKSWLFGREARTLSRYEQSLVAEFKAASFVSDAEAHQFKSNLATEQQHKIVALANGVDTEFFNPALFDHKIEKGLVVFTGEMNYQPNIDAVIWFAGDVLPQLLQRQTVRFCIVGRNPTAEVLALRTENIEVTGRVDDVRPYLARAQLVVAPMLFARGVKNKVLEAMAMAKPIVATTAAMFGLDAARHTDAIEIADTSESFTRACLHLLERSELAYLSRQIVEQHFGWQASANTLTSLLIDANDGPNA